MKILGEQKSSATVSHIHGQLFFRLDHSKTKLRWKYKSSSWIGKKITEELNGEWNFWRHALRSCFYQPRWYMKRKCLERKFDGKQELKEEDETA